MAYREHICSLIVQLEWTLFDITHMAGRPPERSEDGLATQQRGLLPSAGLIGARNRRPKTQDITYRKERIHTRDGKHMGDGNIPENGTY